MKDTREYAAAPPVSGQLFAFGSPTSSIPASKVPTKPLVMLAYVCLEGSRSRVELSQLFWSHLAGQRTKKGERKDFSNYGVARAIVKRELGVDIEDDAQVAAFPCDAKEFMRALGNGQAEAALRLYRRGPLLQGVESLSRLKLSAEFLDWLDAKRAALARLAQGALLEIAQDPRYRGCATRCAEETYEAARGGQHLGLLAQLHGLLADLESPLAADARRRLESRLAALLADEVTPESFRLYLVMSLQTVPNLAAAQVAADLSPQAGAACLAELRSAKLVSADNAVINPEVAAFHFGEHAEVKMALLRALADCTPTEQAFAIFRTLLETGHTFGGMGYWNKARAAYYAQASDLAGAQDFRAVAATLGQLQKAETDSQQPPHSESRALRAYALERLGRYQEGLEALRGVDETPEVAVVKAALLARTANYEAAKALAASVKNVSPTPWVNALAANTLGQVAYENDYLVGAEAAFSQAAVQWLLAGEPQRELGALMNRANVLEQLGRTEDALNVYNEILGKSGQNDALQVRTLLNLGYLYENLERWGEARQQYQEALSHALGSDLLREDSVLVARVYNNLGHTLWRLGDEAARDYLKRALDLAQGAGERALFATALGNLALVNRDVSRLGAALDLLKGLDNAHELGVYRELYASLQVERGVAPVERAGGTL